VCGSVGSDIGFCRIHAYSELAHVDECAARTRRSQVVYWERALDAELDGVYEVLLLQHFQTKRPIAVQLC